MSAFPLSSQKRANQHAAGKHLMTHLQQLVLAECLFRQHKKIGLWDNMVWFEASEQYELSLIIFVCLIVLIKQFWKIEKLIVFSRGYNICLLNRY